MEEIGGHISPDTLLCLLRTTHAPCAVTPEVLGIDDWARRRGRSYGTVLVDLERHRIVDLLPDRTAETLAAWLPEHPGMEVIVRDRSTEYARGAALGAPEAVQVLDRWHLLRNVREVGERLLDRNSWDLRGLATSADGRRSRPVRRGGAACGGTPQGRRAPCPDQAPDGRRWDHRRYRAATRGDPHHGAALPFRRRPTRAGLPAAAKHA
jgi:hypothetical protein